VLVNADVLLVTEVYAAGEAPISGADGRTLCRAVRGRGRVDPVFVEDVETLPKVLNDLLQPGDVLLTLGAGSIGTVAANLSDTLARLQAGGKA
jgi:UDP-N-acetylmuramate--alanine ligase